MKKFNVSIKEINYGAAVVEANTKEEAEKLVYDMYFNGEIHWTDNEINEIDAIEESAII